MSWIVVNMPWQITRSKEAADLGQVFVDTVNRVKEAYRTSHPALAAMDVAGNSVLVEEAIAVQDDYPWVTFIDDPLSIEDWRESGLRQLANAPTALQPALKALLLHRYAARLESYYLNNHPDVIRTQEACKTQRELERTREFVHHEACQVGVQIEILSKGETRRLLIGDIVKDGMDSGCCAGGISDEDIVLRYRDLRHLITGP